MVWKYTSWSTSLQGRQSWKHGISQATRHQCLWQQWRLSYTLDFELRRPHERTTCYPPVDGHHTSVTQFPWHQDCTQSSHVLAPCLQVQVCIQGESADNWLSMTCIGILQEVVTVLLIWKEVFQFGSFMFAWGMKTLLCWDFFCHLILSSIFKLAPGF